MPSQRTGCPRVGPVPSSLVWLAFANDGAEELFVTAAGTDLRQHHAFAREAERVRYGFVQKLNELHIEELAYSDDIQRSNDPEVSNARLRRQLADLRERFFPAQNSINRLGAVHLFILLAWCGLMAGLGVRNMNKGIANA